MMSLLLGLAAGTTAAGASVDKIATCVTRRDFPATVKLAETARGSTEESAAFSHLSRAIEQCGGLGAAQTQLSDAVALRLYLNTITGRRSKAISTSTTPDDIASLQIMNANGRPLEEVAILCATNRDVAVTHAFLKAAPGSKAGKEALAAFAGMLARCSQQGDQLRFNSSQLRYIVARIAYRSIFKDAPFGPNR